MDITRAAILAIAISFVAYDSAQAQEPYVCCDPCYSSPAVITTYYASPAATYPSGAVGWTRYRPLFGDYVTRIRYGGYSPVVYGPGWLW